MASGDVIHEVTGMVVDTDRLDHGGTGDVRHVHYLTGRVNKSSSSDTSYIDYGSTINAEHFLGTSDPQPELLTKVGKTYTLKLIEE